MATFNINRLHYDSDDTEDPDELAIDPELQRFCDNFTFEVRIFLVHPFR